MATKYTVHLLNSAGQSIGTHGPLGLTAAKSYAQKAADKHGKSCKLVPVRSKARARSNPVHVPTAAQDATTSAKLVAFRAKYGGDAESCPTCTRAPTRPFRRIVDGKIVEGCVDACHTGQFTGLSSSNAWHTRPEARILRKETFDHLKTLAQKNPKLRTVEEKAILLYRLMERQEAQGKYDAAHKTRLKIAALNEILGGGMAATTARVRAAGHARRNPDDDLPSVQDGKASYDADFAAGFAAGKKCVKRKPDASGIDAKKAYKRVSMVHGSWWVDGFKAAISIANGADNETSARIAKKMALANPRSPPQYVVNVQSWDGGFLGKHHKVYSRADVGTVAKNEADRYSESNLNRFIGTLQVLKPDGIKVLSTYQWKPGLGRWVHLGGTVISALES